MCQQKHLAKSPMTGRASCRLLRRRAVRAQAAVGLQLIKLHKITSTRVLIVAIITNYNKLKYCNQTVNAFRVKWYLLLVRFIAFSILNKVKYVHVCYEYYIWNSLGMTCFTVKTICCFNIICPPSLNVFYRNTKKNSLVLIIKKYSVLAGKNSLKVNTTA